MCPQPGVALPAAGKEVTDAMAKVIASHADGMQMQPLERFGFYEESRACYAVVQCLERRPYGNVILQKGVVGPDGKDLKPQAAAPEPAKKKQKH